MKKFKFKGTMFATILLLVLVLGIFSSVNVYAKQDITYNVIGNQDNPNGKTENIPKIIQSNINIDYVNIDNITNNFSEDVKKKLTKSEMNKIEFVKNNKNTYSLKEKNVKTLINNKNVAKEQIEKIKNNYKFTLDTIQNLRKNFLENTTQNKEMIKEQWKNVLEQWKEEKKEIKNTYNLVTESRLNSVVVRMSVLENKLYNYKDNYVNENEELSNENKEKLDEFSNLISKAKVLFEEANTLQEQNSDEDVVKEKLKEVDEILKNANQYLIKEIFPMLRSIGVNDVGNLLKIEDNDTLLVVDN